MPTYLVVEPISVIALDLAASIREFDSSAHVIVAGTPEDAGSAIANYDAVDVAFLHAHPSKIALAPLARKLSASGARCVFMGDAAEEARVANFALLERPFSTETLSNLLARLMQKARVPT